MTIRELMQFWDTKAPLSLAEEWDNPGLLVGDPDTPVTGVLTTLDITPAAVEQAAAIGANLIVSHHPVIFTPLRRLAVGSAPYLLAAKGIAALCLHTNLDKAAGGVNDSLIAQLGWPAAEVAEDGLCRLVALSAPLTPDELASLVTNRLHTAIRMTAGKGVIHTVGVCSGAGGDCLLPLAGRVDAILTGELRHHEFLAFAEAGVTAIDAGHYATEIVAAETLRQVITAAFPSLPVEQFRQAAPYETIWTKG